MAFAFGFEFIVLVVIVALIFDFYNGVNDAANSIATVVATRVLHPWQAVLLAAFFNFLGPFALGTAVAQTIAKGIIDPNDATTEVVLAALVGGIAWTALATHQGIPISVSHSIMGGLIGAGVAGAGWGTLQVPTATKVLPALELMGVGALAGAVVTLVGVAIARKRPVVPVLLGAFIGSGVWLAVNILTGDIKLDKFLATFLFIFYSPMLGFVGAYALNALIRIAFRRASPRRMRKVFGVLQLASASFYSLGHGTNDAQKTMGVITLALFANGFLPTLEVPVWVILASAGAIALGTAVGGHKVVHTMGMKLTHLSPDQGFSAETSSALGLYFLAKFGVPVSTTHSITGSILGVGAVQGTRHVNWFVARNVVTAWIITIPASALVSFVAALVIRGVLTAIYG